MALRGCFLRIAWLSLRSLNHLSMMIPFGAIRQPRQKRGTATMARAYLENSLAIQLRRSQLTPIRGFLIKERGDAVGGFAAFPSIGKPRDRIVDHRRVNHGTKRAREGLGGGDGMGGNL